MTEKAKKIKLVVLDVDGTLTDGKIYIDNNGVETKAFNVKDGFAIASGRSEGIEFVIITGRKSKVVEIRAKELGIVEIHQAVKNKIEVLKNIINDRDLTFEDTAYMGDDINDLPAMKLVGLKGATFDAAQEVKNIADFISTSKGGDGAVREFVEYILRVQQKWENIVKKYEFKMNQ